MADRAVVGTVRRLQVQRSPLKQRPAGSGPYDPGPLLQVDALEVGPRGCTGLLGPAGTRVVDVHHGDHPQTRLVRDVNGLSLLPTAHLERLRLRYGRHLADGIAGENVLLDALRLTEDDLAGTLLLETDGDPVELTAARAAPPCVEFTQHLLGRDVGDLGPEVRAALDDLGRGARGFYVRVGGTGTVRPGMRLLRA